MLQNTITSNYLQETADITVIYAPYYYRWSTTGQVQERKYRNNQIVHSEKKIIEEEVKKLINNIESYRGYCTKCGKEVRVVYTGYGYLDKGKTGRKLDRENILRLIDDAEQNKFQAVFTPYSSRLGRRRSVSATIRDKLKDLGVQIYSLHQPITLKCPDCFDPLDDDAAVINETISDMQAELELSQIRRNYKNGMPVRIKEGKPSGSLAFGLVKKYKIQGLDARGNEIIEEDYAWDDKKVEIVKRIAEEYMSGQGTWKVSQRLNGDGIPSPQGKKWGRSAILCILKNPAYAGFTRFGWKPVKNGKRIIQPRDKWMLEKAVWPGIWGDNSLEHWEKIQAEIARRATVGGRAVGSDGLLIGLLKCWHCKYSMFQAKGAKTFKNGKPYLWRGYACGTFMHRGVCTHNGKKQSVVDKHVLNEVLKLANDETRKSFYEKLSKTKEKNLTETIREKRAKLKSLTQEFNRVTEAYRRGIDTLEEYAKNKTELLPAIQDVQRELNSLEAGLEQLPKFSWDKQYEYVIKRFLKSPSSKEDKQIVKSILNRLIDRIEIRRKPFYIKIFYRVDS